MPLSNCGPSRLVAKIDQATRDERMKKVMEGPRMQPGEPMPLDGKRLIFSGFPYVVDA